MIYQESTFVNPATTSEWFSLSVVNMWDLDTKPCCYRNGIPFCLKKNTAKYTKSWQSETVEPTDDQKSELINMGYACV